MRRAPRYGARIRYLSYFWKQLCEPEPSVLASHRGEGTEVTRFVSMVRDKQETRLLPCGAHARELLPQERRLKREAAGGAERPVPAKGAVRAPDSTEFQPHRLGERPAPSGSCCQPNHLLELRPETMGIHLACLSFSEDKWSSLPRGCRLTKLIPGPSGRCSSPRDPSAIKAS